jgi:replication-associated recombination protein RarA
MEYEAVHFAAELEEFNPTMLWNRLKIIASEDIGPANATIPLLVDYLQKQYQTEKVKLAENSHKLYLTNAVVCLCRSQKSRITDDLQTIVYTERENSKLPPIPEFALDKHTAHGKAMGKDTDDFYSEGNKIVNEAFPNPYTEKAKKLLKKDT